MSSSAWLPLTEWGARFTLLALLALSILSVAIILDRRKLLKSRACAQSLEELRSQIRLKKLGGISDSHSLLTEYAQLLTGPFSSASPEAIDRATRSFLNQERQKLEKGLTLLATIGSNAPFIGLFGTVLGIIQAFGELSSKQTGSSAVMGAISEALIATAVGLLVAIPAVIAFNSFQRRIRDLLVPCEILRDDFIASREKKE